MGRNASSSAEAELAHTPVRGASQLAARSFTAQSSSDQFHKVATAILTKAMPPTAWASPVETGSPFFAFR